MTIHLTPVEWERIAAAGSGVLFREGGIAAPSLDDKSTWRDIRPAEFVEAAQPCETCHGLGTVWTGDIGKKFVVPCPDCHDGKRRVAVVVPCPTCSIKQDGRIRPGLELCTRCVPRHWEFCSTCTVWSDDEFTITSKAGLITVGHVVVTWGPLMVVLYEEWELGGDHAECIAVDEWGGAIHIEARKGDDDAYGWHVTLPPDVDPQSLVGQYAIGVEVVS